MHLDGYNPQEKGENPYCGRALSFGPENCTEKKEREREKEKKKKKGVGGGGNSWVGVVVVLRTHAVESSCAN